MDLVVVEPQVLVQCILEPIQTEIQVNGVDENTYEPKATQSQEPSETIMQNIAKRILFKAVVVLEKSVMIL